MDGIRAQYPDSGPTAEKWFLNANTILTDRRFVRLDGVTLDGNSIDGWFPQSANAVFCVVPSSGFTGGLLDKDLDHAACSSQGYMYTPIDWKDVEVTGYFKFESVPLISGSSGITSIHISARGADRSKVSTHYCPGCSYICEIASNGLVRFAKKQFHVSITPREWQQCLLKSAISQGWFGLKFVVYNVGIGTGTNAGVKLECWIDRGNVNKWVKVAETVDRGNWGVNDNCGLTTTKDQILNFGGPVIEYAFNNIGIVRFKYLGVRSVAPGASFPTDPPVIDPTGTRIFNSLIMHYRIGMSVSPTCQSEIPVDPNPPPPPPEPGKITITKKTASTSDILQ